jgi:hypothetical protein
MIGWHAVSVLAEAHAKGIKADYAAAWPNIRRRAFDRDFKDIDSSLGRGFYYDLGYIPCDKVWESVSRTQEYAYDDWAMAVLADAIGAKDDAATLRKRSRRTTATLSTPKPASRARASRTAAGGRTMTRSRSATMSKNGATIPRRTAGRRPSSTSTTSTA